MYQNLNLVSESIEIKNDADSYFIKGDIENAKALINPNLLFKLANIKQDFLSNIDIPIKSKNFFSFRISKFKKLENLKIDSIINFDEIYLSKKYKNLIYLKGGTINSKYENKQLNADLTSNFIFSNNLESKNDYKKNKIKLFLKSKNNKNFKINGNISNKKTLLNPKNFFNFLGLDPNLISEGNINIETDNQFEFAVNKNKIENYLINSKINFDKLEFNTKIKMFCI